VKNTIDYLLKIIIYLLLFITILSCNNSNSKTNNINIQPGKWLLNFKISHEYIPVNLEISKKNDTSYVFTIINGKEKIIYTDTNILIRKNTILITDPVFESWFEGKIISDKKIIGKWYKGKDYFIPFEANYGISERFILTRKTVPENVNGKWEATFSPSTNEAYKAIGIFNQNGNYIEGTFATEFGDYRYLTGVIDDDSLKLSTFDGSHVFLFKAKYSNDSLKGTFWSGNHWKENWVAIKNEKFQLRNPEELTFLKEGYENISFSLPDLDSNIVKFPSPVFTNKVVIINIMGSWCPNCKDELLYLSNLYKKYHPLGLEVISIAFEREKDFWKNVQAVKKEKAFAKAQHLFLIGGKASKVEASKVFPMLNQIISFPTSIFIDKKGKIRKIRTGFYGPATGKYYTEYCQRTDSFIRLLLNEN
jgi:thiol-disulfide isomerase/thioredoxin